MAKEGPNASFPSNNSHIDPPTTTISSSQHLQLHQQEKKTFAATLNNEPRPDECTLTRGALERRCGVFGARFTGQCILFCFLCWMYYSVILRLDKGEAGMLRGGGGSPVHRGVGGRRTRRTFPQELGMSSVLQNLGWKDKRDLQSAAEHLCHGGGGVSV